MIDIDSDGVQQVDLPASVAASTDLDEVASAIQAAVQALARRSRRPARTTRPSASSAARRWAAATRRTSCSSRAPARARQRRPELVRSGAARGEQQRHSAAQARRQRGRHFDERPGDPQAAEDAQIHVGDNASAGSPGSDGSGNLELQAYTDAFALLDTKTDFSLLAVPGENTTALVDAAMGYCANRPLRDVFYIGEMTAGCGRRPRTPRRSAVARPSPNSYGALYFPWIKALDPTGVSAEPVLLPPSGYIAGLYARIDAIAASGRRRPVRAASLGGAVGLASELTDSAARQPQPVGVERDPPLRRRRHRVLRGADDRGSDPEWTLRAGPADGDHAAGQHLLRHPVGGLRAQRRAALVAAAAEHQLVHDDAVPAAAPSRARRPRRPSSSSATARRPPRPTSTGDRERARGLRAVEAGGVRGRAASARRPARPA